MAPPPYRSQVKGEQVYSSPPPLLTGALRGGTQTNTMLQASGRADLLVQGDVVNPDALLSGEVVGAVVAVLQQRPAVRRAGTRMAGVARTPQPEQAAGSTQPLRAGVIIIQKA